MRQTYDFSFDLKDAILYYLGTLLISSGVVFIFKSDLGVSSWDVLHTAIMLATPLTFGMAIILISTLITAFVVLYNKTPGYLFMIIPFVLVGLQVDIFDQVILEDYGPTGALRYVTFLGGLLLIPLGTVFLMLSKYPAGIYDELMLTLMRIFNTNRLAVVRVIMESTPVALGVLISATFAGTIGNLHYGTLVIVATAGPLIQGYLILYRRLKHGDQQTD